MDFTSYGTRFDKLNASPAGLDGLHVKIYNHLTPMGS